MGSRHPLDIFRSTDDGFDHASRRRRTVPGKVLVSSSRNDKPSGKAARGAGLLGGGRKSSGKSAKAPKTPKLLGARRALSPAALSAEGASRKLLYGAGVVAVLLALTLALRSTFIDDGPATLPMLSSSTSPGAEPAEAGALLGEARDAGSAVGVSTVLAATYPPTPKGLELAWFAHDELVARGFEGVDVALIPGDDGAPSAYQLVVGWATPGALDEVRAALQALDDWPGQSGRPFAQARVIGHPLAAAAGS